jgi:peptide-methionine (R)-S-oxide reductase
MDAPLMKGRASMITNRRTLLLAGLGVGAGVVALRSRGQSRAAAARHYEVEHTDAEWHRILTPEQFEVLRREGTERAFTSPLNHEKRAGIFACAGCELPVFSSKTKFDSGTGWPSFWAALDNAVDTSQDFAFGMARTALQCHRCGGHLGHVFDDGPPPTHQRYCINGVALKFNPQAL